MTVTESEGGKGGNKISSMNEVVIQLEEIHKHNALVEEHHKAEVAQLRETCAVATTTPQDEAGREQTSTTETTQEVLEQHDT